jgi:hypothetical protein
MFITFAFEMPFIEVLEPIKEQENMFEVWSIGLFSQSNKMFPPIQTPALFDHHSHSRYKALFILRLLRLKCGPDRISLLQSGLF